MEFDLRDAGPKMQACSERERKFAWHYLLNGGNGAQAARDAGYSDHLGGAKVRAHHLLHREHVLDAIEELGRKQFRSMLVPAIAAMHALINKPDHPAHARTVETVLSRLGLAERQAIDVQHTHTDRTGVAMMERIRELAKKHGLDAEALLAGARPDMKVIEHERGVEGDGAPVPGVFSQPAGKAELDEGGI